jgi:hypothetical protein
MKFEMLLAQFNSFTVDIITISFLDICNNPNFFNDYRIVFKKIFILLKDWKQAMNALANWLAFDSD